MPAFETMDRHDKAVLWTYEGKDGYGKAKRSAEGIELDVRWESGRREGLSAQGSPIAIDANVVVDREIAIGGLMWKGSMDDLPGTANPQDRTPTSDVMEVVDYREIPDIKGRNIRRVVSLMRYRDTLPDSV